MGVGPDKGSHTDDLAIGKGLGGDGRGGITTRVPLKSLVDVAQDELLNLVKVLDTLAASVAANDALDEQGRLVAHSELLIDKQLWEALK